ncbi:MAG: ester cyclase [Bacteroidia bacterium]|nr:ester cyclase [Bacteroidia bacterium]
MIKELNKAVVAQYIENVLNTGETNNIDDFISPDYTEIYQKQRYSIGIEGAKKHITGVRETYPDLHLSIDQQFSDADWVITSYTMTGTHLGKWMGIKPTGKKIQVTGVNLDKVVNGKIVEHGGATNLFESLLEIGAIRLIE